MGSKSSQANSAQTTQNYDQRQVNSTTIDDRDLTNVYDWSDHSTRTNIDNSIDVRDSSDRSNRQSWYSEANDSSQRNTTTVNYTGTDAGAAKLLEGISRDQTDGIKTIAGFGDDALRRMGESATSMYATAGSNAVRSFDLATQRSTDAWSATVEKSSGLIDSLLKGASNTVNAARDISQQAITSFQPAENKAQDTSLKLGMIAAAGVAVLMLTRKK